MTDTAIRNAAALKDGLESEIRALEQKIREKKDELERTKAFISAWHAFADESSKKRVSDLFPVHDTSGQQQKPQNPKKEFVAARVAEIIREAGVPKSRAELFKALKAQGIVLQGKNPEMVLSTMLWRSSDTIVRLPSHGYWLADVPYDPAGYDPKKMTPDIFG